MGKLIAFIISLTIFISFTSKALAQSQDPVITAAGDIVCDNSNTNYSSSTCHQKFISDTILWINPTAVLTLGDDQYPDGVLSDFNNYYDPTWGRFKNITYPIPGNHDYHTSGGSGYYTYFGSRAGDPSKGYYSYNIGSWHLIALNGEISHSSSSTQVIWLKSDLAANNNSCVLAYVHEPRFSSGSTHGSNTGMAAVFQALYDYKADLLLAGHEHVYERFAPQSPSATNEPTRGVREFIVGNGGNSLYSFNTPLPNSEFRYNSGFTVLKLTLHPTSYDWQLIKDDANHTVIDSGSDNCVGIVATPTPTTGPSPTAGLLLGDANGDGTVDLIDYVIWLNNYGKSSTGTSNGDFNNDNTVDLIDYVIWLNNYGKQV